MARALTNKTKPPKKSTNWAFIFLSRIQTTRTVTASEIKTPIIFSEFLSVEFAHVFVMWQTTHRCCSKRKVREEVLLFADVSDLWIHCRRFYE
jgi:hypothetical protein